MFKNYIRVAVRNILRGKFYSVINILGLAIGIAGFILISLWVKDELNYDTHFKDSERIYRIESSLVTEGVPKPMAATDPRLANHIREECPQVGNVVRLFKMPTLLSVDSTIYFEEQTYYADSTFFDVFSFEFLIGNPQDALRKRGSIVLTSSVTSKLFGTANPLGKVVCINNNRTRTESRVYTVTGVIRDNLRTSHFHPGAIIVKPGYMDTFEPFYLKLNSGYSVQYFIDHVWKRVYEEDFSDDYLPDNQDITLDRLQPLTRIHLGQNKWEDLESNGDIVLVYIFGAIGILILLFACVNYINLATARSFSRSREIGVRKVLGASRRQVIVQFVIESIIISLVSSVIALSFTEMILPFFNELSDKELRLNVFDPFTICLVLTLAVLVGFLSGIYPAFFISSFQPIKALKGTLDTSKNKPTLRKVLVVTQFSISIVMLIATMVIAQQLRFVKNKNLGFDSDRVLLVDLGDQKVNSNREALKNELLKNPNILKVAASYNIPGSEINHTYITFETQHGMEAKLINSMFVDYDYVDVMGLKLTEGSGFDSSMLSRLDTAAFIIVNESAKKMLGWETAVGKKIGTGKTYGHRDGFCIGVVNDFHASSLHDTISPLVLALGTLGRPEGKSKFLSVKIKGHDMDKTIMFIEKLYRSFGQGYPFRYSYMDEQFNAQYRKEEKQKILFYYFAGLSIFISCLGLIGLTSFITKQRSKEIGIRRISGASIVNIMFLLSKDFIQMVFIALIAATPLAYIIMNAWLQLFAYHIRISWILSLVAGLITLFLVMITISIQTVIAIRKSPATVLRYE